MFFFQWNSSPLFFISHSKPNIIITFILEAQAPLQGILPIWSNQAIPATSSDVKICIDKQIFSASRNAEFLNLQNGNKYWWASLLKPCDMQKYLQIHSYFQHQ